MTIREKFKLGTPVFLISDPDQICRQVVYILITPNGLEYGVRLDDGEPVYFYDDELTEERIVI